MPVSPATSRCLLGREHLLHRFPELLCLFPTANLLQQVGVLRHHVHQLQRRPVHPGVDVIRQGYILGALPLGAKIHQDFICYPPPNDF